MSIQRTPLLSAGGAVTGTLGGIKSASQAIIQERRREAKAARPALTRLPLTRYQLRMRRRKGKG